jgi:predicted transposase YbfD/YdcC
MKTEEKSNEITAVPELLDTLDTSDAIMTTDALTCQKSIAKKIADKRASYVLAVKNNQESLQTTNLLYVKRLRQMTAYNL